MSSYWQPPPKTWGNWRSSSRSRRPYSAHEAERPNSATELLDLTNRGDIVLDPFLGSGSTLIAAENIGRVFRGV
jgi:DNA modification methylase